MNILYLTAWDSYGIQFNGYLLSKQLERSGFSCHMYVAQKRFDEPSINKLGSDLTLKLDKFINAAENYFSIQRFFNFSFNELFSTDWYKNADVVHIQMAHATPFLSLLSISKLAREKKLVWTVHDPWLLTGHCIYFMDCPRWETGCGYCPDLKRHLPMRNDLTSFNWRIKREVFKKVNANLVVASEWMLDIVKKSPILSHLSCTLIPFGTDVEIFKPLDKAECRRKLNIAEDCYVISCRWASHNAFKGIDYLKKALEDLYLDKPTYILGFDSYVSKPDLPDRYIFMNLGWVDDQTKIAEILNASDVFVMPSLAESFGLMAIETMSCGVPIIVFDGTSLSNVVQAPIGGISIPRDATILAVEIRNLITDLNKQKNISQNARNIAVDKYQFETYAAKHADLYRSI